MGPPSGRSGLKSAKATAAIHRRRRNAITNLRPSTPGNRDVSSLDITLISNGSVVQPAVSTSNGWKFGRPFHKLFNRFPQTLNREPGTFLNPLFRHANPTLIQYLLSYSSPLFTGYCSLFRPCLRPPSPPRLLDRNAILPGAVASKLVTVEIVQGERLIGVRNLAVARLQGNNRKVAIGRSVTGVKTIIPTINTRAPVF